MATGRAVTTEVHMEYTGILGLVPKDGECFVVVPDARGHHHRHDAYLWVLNKGSWVVERAGEIIDDGELPHRFDLVRHEIRVDNGTSSRLSLLSKNILRLHDGCPVAKPGCGKIRSSLIETPVRDLAALCKVSRGTLAASFVDQDYEWRFIKPESGGRMRLTQAVRHRFTIVGGTLAMQLVDGSTTTHLSIDAYEDEPRIDVIVQNFPENNTPHEIDEHVMIHYDLADPSIPPDQRRPLKKSASPHTGPALPGHGDDTIWARMEEKSARGEGGPEARMVIMIVRGANCPPGLWTL